ncbi:MAG: DUF4783 domain-containing protein [Chitinophagales bacterium]|jgi:hypothetical protein|nr:DUF4783 domain-containing protein [Chitinophagales bacterium]
MKSVFFMFLLSLTTQAAFSQNFDGVTSALRNGDAGAIAQNIQGTVEITIKDTEASYSKAQAEQVLRKFFELNRPKSFSIAHQGTSPEGSKYFIGSLVTTGGTYRTYVYAKTGGNALTIQEIRLEVQ